MQTLVVFCSKWRKFHIFRFWWRFLGNHPRKNDTIPQCSLFFDRERSGTVSKKYRAQSGVYPTAPYIHLIKKPYSVDISSFVSYPNSLILRRKYIICCTQHQTNQGVTCALLQQRYYTSTSRGKFLIFIPPGGLCNSFYPDTMIIIICLGGMGNGKRIQPLEKL